MSMPVQAATAIYSPQPIRPSMGKRDTEQEDGAWVLPEIHTPSILSNVFEGWPSFMLTSPSPPTDENEYEVPEARPQNPSPQSPDSLDYHSARSESIDSAASPEQRQKQRKHRRPRSSIAVGNEVNELLNKDDVRKAISVLQEAVSCMNMTDEPDQNPGSVAKIYSRMLKTLCEPNLANVVNDMSGVDLKQPDAIYNSVVWRLFTRVVESGYTLEKDAHISVVNFLVRHDYRSLALQALYSFPRIGWDTEIYRLAISLHLMQTPQQVEQAEWLLGDYGRPFIEVTNPLAVTDLPPVRIETPLMNSVTDHDRFKLWMYYQSALNGTEWGSEKDQYEIKRRQTLSALELQKERRRSLTDRAMRWMNIETGPERMEREHMDADNTMIFTSISKKQFEYGWQVYSAMGKAVNQFTPRVVMHLCWRAFNDTPLSNVSRRILWESRAWAVYSRFMCSEYLHPEQAETPGFLRDLLSINATSAESRSLARYVKAMNVYNTLERLKLNQLLTDEHVIVPIVCALLHECQGTPTTIMKMCRKAFDIWHRKAELDTSHGLNSSGSFSMYWALMIFCLKSGDVSDFAEVLQCLEGQLTLLPTSLLAPIQTFHDRYLLCGHRDTEGAASCYFDGYLFQPVKYTDDSGDRQVEEMDQWGFVAPTATVTQERRKSAMAEPMAYIDHALHKRTNINEIQATCLARAVGMGIAKDEILEPKTLFVSRNKRYGLVRHCLQSPDMGNTASKKRKERPSVIRTEIPDNEYSNTTATSVNSILVNSNFNPQKQSNLPTAENAFQFPNSISNDRVNQDLAQTQQQDQQIDANEQSVTSLNQLTLSSQNQLTATSVRSIGRNLDIDECIGRLLEIGRSGKVHRSLCFKNSEIIAICRAAQEVFMSQPTLIELNPPVKILGDIHGQYHDLIRLFEMGGFPPDSNYLFLGDYVDRGKQSLETILLLFCYKIKFPENFFLLRGNHECANVTRVYGFYDECKRRTNVKIWKTFIDAFNALPIAALVAGKIFCVHGGLSPSMHSMDDVRNIMRPTDVPEYGLLNDLLWSDPSETAVDWEDNERGVSYCFGKRIVNDFLAKYDLDLVCRAHMVVEDGYEFFNERTLVTVFSAPNYCGEFDNFGAIMSINEELLCSFELLTPTDHPPARLAALSKSKGRRPSPPMLEPLPQQPEQST